MRSLLLVTLATACGDSAPPIHYTDPGAGQLRLVQDTHAPKSPSGAVVLDLVVGDAPLTGYSVGFDLPLDDTKVTFDNFAPGDALGAGSSPIAAVGKLPTTGPLAHQLVIAQSQKASGTGAVATNTTLPPGTVLLAFELDLVKGAPSGIVFDGTAADFVLPSGGMRDRAGTTVVDAKHVAIGKLELTQ